MNYKSKLEKAFEEYQAECPELFLFTPRESCQLMKALDVWLNFDKITLFTEVSCKNTANGKIVKYEYDETKEPDAFYYFASDLKQKRIYHGTLKKFYNRAKNTNHFTFCEEEQGTILKAVSNVIAENPGEFFYTINKSHEDVHLNCIEGIIIRPQTQISEAFQKSKNKSLYIPNEIITALMMLKRFVLTYDKNYKPKQVKEEPAYHKLLSCKGSFLELSKKMESDISIEGDVTYYDERNDLAITIGADKKLTPSERINVDKLQNMINYKLCESGLNENSEVVLTIDEIMRLRDMRSESKIIAKTKKATQILKTAGVTINSKRASGGINFYSICYYLNGYVHVKPTPEYFKLLQSNKNQFLEYPTALWRIPDKSPNVYNIGNKFIRHCRMNASKSRRELVLSVSTLLELTDIITIDKLESQGLKRQAADKIIKPLTNSLDMLVINNVFKCWRFEKHGGKQLTDDEQIKALKDYDFFSDLNVKAKLLNNPDCENIKRPKTKIKN